MSELFIEFFSEEIPPNLQISARNQLNKFLIKNLTETNLKYKNFEIYSTPTRIAVCISGLPEKIKILPIDYYYTNPIARSSKTMKDCRELVKKNLLIQVGEAS